MNQSDRTHTHADAEVLHVLAGECVFGFVYPNGSQVQLMLQAEEYKSATQYRTLVLFDSVTLLESCAVLHHRSRLGSSVY